MKKIYISPALQCVHIEASTTLASSPFYDPDKEIENNNDIGTKDEGDWDELWDE